LTNHFIIEPLPNLKELDMKKYFILLGVIISTVTLMISCSKSDDATTTAATALTVASKCTDNETVSGSITGIWGLSPSGTYSQAWEGNTPAGGCYDNSSVLGSSGMNITASDSTVLGFSSHFYVTSSSTVTETLKFWSDSSCTNLHSFLSQSKTDITAGDNITILNAPSPYPDYATKFTHKESRYCIYPGTDGMKNYLNSMTGNSFTLTTGSVSDTRPNTEPTFHGLFTSLDNISGSTGTWLYASAWGNASAQDNFSSGGSNSSTAYFSDNASN